jgi:hypothetical protein
VPRVTVTVSVPAKAGRMFGLAMVRLVQPSDIILNISHQPSI